MGLADRDYMKGGYDEGDHPPACTCWKCNEVRHRRRAEEGPRSADGTEDMLEGLPLLLQNRLFWALSPCWQDCSSCVRCEALPGRTLGAIARALRDGYREPI